MTVSVSCLWITSLLLSVCPLESVGFLKQAAHIPSNTSVPFYHFQVFSMEKGGERTQMENIPSILKAILGTP